MLNDKKWFYFISGGIGDSIACLISHPMDITKVRLQLKGELSLIKQQTGLNNIIKLLYSILKNEGIFNGIYNGLSAAILRQLIFSSLRHGIFNIIQLEYYKKYNKNLIFLEQIIIGGIIGAICSFIANPCDVVLIRMQADGHWEYNQRRNYKNVFDGFYQIIKNEGYKCLWRGCNATIIRGILITCSQLPAYHTSKHYLIQSGYFQNTTSTHIISSLISATFASLITCPADVIKTRLMNMKSISINPNFTQNGNQPKQQLLYNGVIDCFVKTYKTEGIRGFYKGLGATIGRLGPHTIVLWNVQELILKTLRNKYGNE